MTYRTLLLVHPFFHSSPFYLTTKILCFTMLFNQPDIRNCPLPSVVCTLILYVVSWTHAAYQPASRSVHSFLHCLWQRVPILYNGLPLFPFKITPYYGEIWTRLMHGALFLPSPHCGWHLHQLSCLCRIHDCDRQITTSVIICHI